MPTTQERLGIVETKVQNLNEKVDDLKIGVKDMHDCLDRTRETLADTLNSMRTESTAQHNELAGKIKDLEKQKQKLMTYGLVGMAFVAGLGWTGQLNIHTLFKFFGL